MAGWTKHLDPSVSKEPWSAAEDAELLRLQKSHGNKWAFIATHLPGRETHSRNLLEILGLRDVRAGSDNRCKNQYHRLTRSRPAAPRGSGTAVTVAVTVAPEAASEAAGATVEGQQEKREEVSPSAAPRSSRASRT